MEKLTQNIYSKLHSIKWAWIKLQRDTKAFNYKYATLSQIQDKFAEAIQEQGLVIIHSVLNGSVRTEIRDTESTDFVVSEIEMSQGIKPQDKGSEITYYRRYNLLSLLDLEVSDDDGKQAQESKPTEKQEQKNWLNYESFKEIVEAGNTTETEIANVIREDNFILSQYAKNAVRHYVETWDIDKSKFYQQAK